MSEFQKVKANIFTYEKIYTKVVQDFRDMVDIIKDDEIPTREEIINLIYAEQLKNSEILNGETSSKKIIKTKEPVSTKKHIHNHIEEIKKNPDSKTENLKAILDLLSGIGDSDKKVLFTTLKDTKISDLKTSIEDIMEAFDVK